MPIASVNPTTGDVERTFEPHDAPEVERRLKAAVAGAAAMRSSDFAVRAGWLKTTADLIEADCEDLARTIVTEMGKPITQARAEVRKSAATMRYYADHAEAFLADALLADPAAVGAGRAYTRYDPLGVVLAVMPWNYPIWQVVRFAAPALMAGNSGLLKHASNVPQSALYLDTLFRRGGFPDGAFGTLLVDPATVADLVVDPRVQAVTLTGSEGAGRAVGELAGRAIKKTVLELGGSDPFIVMPSANLEDAATMAVTARMNNNGQSCIAGKRFIVHTEIYEEFSTLFADKVAALTVGDPLDEAIQIGPLATAAGRQELDELVRDAIRHGGRVLAQAAMPDATTGWFYPPTLLESIGPDARLFLEEAFGPVAVLYRVDDEQDAITLANGTRFGLSSAVWTQDSSQQDRFIRGLDAGAVFVNGMSISYPELSFGGIKASGHGRELGWAGIREFCNLKSVWIAGRPG